MRTVTTLMLAALAGGCNDSTVAVGNDNPLGTVGGIVFDGINETPLAGVMVKVVSGGQTLQATSGADGVFGVAKVPSGSVIIEMSLMGYETAIIPTFLQGSAGNFPVKSPQITIGPIGLLKNDGTFNVRVVDENGGPVPMVSAVAATQVRYVDYSGGGLTFQGQYVVNAVSGPDGLLKFTRLPEYGNLSTGQYAYQQHDSLTVSIAPTKITGTESYNFAGISQTFQVSHLDQQMGLAPTITLAGPHSALTVLASNVAYIVSSNIVNLFQGLQIPASGPINLEFNQAINSNTVRVQLFNEDGVTPAAAMPRVTVNTNLLSITPSSALVDGARYNVAIHADSIYAGGTLTGGSGELNITAPFFVQQTAGVTPTVNVASVSKTTTASQIVQVTFTLNEPIGLGQGSNGQIDCVAFYDMVNLDNGDPAAYVGEWENNGANVQCFNMGSPPPGLNITTLVPVEQAPIITGFASKFRLNVNNVFPAGTNSSACKPGVPLGTCSGPQSGTKIHLVFSMLPINQTVRRTNGQPVTDDPVKLVVTIP